MAETFFLGSWNGEPIQWELVSVQGTEALAISRRVLGVAEWSALARWVRRFAGGAFDGPDRSLLAAEVGVGGVSIPSYDLVRRWASDAKRAAEPAPGLDPGGWLRRDGATGGTHWWLADEGEIGPNTRMCVLGNGRIRRLGFSATGAILGVRPIIAIRR